MLGKSLEQTKFKRELETRLVWMLTKSTNKTCGVLCEIRWWSLSLLCERNKIPCSLLQNRADQPFLFPASSLSRSLRSSFVYCCLYLFPVVVAAGRLHNAKLMSWLTCCLVVRKDQWLNIWVSIEKSPMLNKGVFPSHWAEKFGMFARSGLLFPCLHASAIQSYTVYTQRFVCIQGQNMSPEFLFVLSIRRVAGADNVTLHLVQNCQCMTSQSIIPPPCSIQHDILQILT